MSDQLPNDEELDLDESPDLDDEPSSAHIDLMPTHEVDEKQLLLLMKDWRRGRATRNVRQAISDGYVAVFTAAMITAMVVSAIVHAQQVAADCSTASCNSGRSLLPWAAVAGLLVLTLAAARMFGPVLASAAEGFWLMDAPLQRSKLLVRRLWMALGAALVSGLLLGALVAALTGSSSSAILAWSAATGLSAAGVTAFAAAEQGAERRWTVKLLQVVVSLAGLVVLVIVVATAAGWVDIRVTDEFSIRLALILSGVGLVLGIVGAGVAIHRLNQIRRSRLTSGGSLVSGMQGAAFALDFGLVRDILVEREAMERGRVKPTRGRGLGLQALVWRDVQRLIRYPKPLFLLVVSVVVPYAVQALGLGPLNAPISALVLMAALIPFFSTLRVLSRTKGLARAFPYNTGEIRTAASVVPSVLTAIWAMAVIPAYLGVSTEEAGNSPVRAVQIALVTAIAGLLAAIRWVSAKSADYSKPMLATQMGAMPPGLLINLIRGFDIVALVTFPVIIGWSPWISLVIALIAFSILRSGGLDRDSLMEMQEDQKRQMEEQKKKSSGAGGGDKVKISRGR